MSPEAWRDAYLQPLREATAPRPEPLPPLPAQAWFRPPMHEPPTSLGDLYDAGIRSGHGESRALLERRLGEYDDMVAQLEARRREADHLRLELETARWVAERDTQERERAIAAAVARIAEIEGSKAWRATWPMRVAGHAVKRSLRAMASTPSRIRRMLPRLATARAIARDQGVSELARRLAAKMRTREAPIAGLTRRPGLAPRIEPLDVPSSEMPRVSVIIPTYGQDLHTYSCLVAVAQEAAGIALEAIVADDAAPTPASEALRPVTGVRFERAAANQGFLRNCNRAAALARGEYLLFLNNDAVMAPGSIAAMLAVFERFPDAGAVGAKLVWPDGRLQEAGVIVWRDGSAWNWGRGEDPAKPEYNYVRAADYCSAACLLVPRALFEQLGGFDERYVPAYYEDTDLCLRVREAGRKVYYQPAAEVVHFEGVSHGTDTGAGMKRHQVENQGRFRERWQQAIAHHRPNGMLPRLEADRDASLRVMFVEACMLTPDQDSGSLRTFRLLGAMRSLGWKVTFLAANLESREPYVEQLRQAGIEVLHEPWNSSVEEVLAARGGELDIVVLARYYIAGPLIPAVRRHAPRALLVFDTLDLHYVRNRRLAQLQGGAAMALASEAIYRDEIESVRRSDVTWVVSDVEQRMLEREVPGATVLVQSNIHDPVGSSRGYAEREGLLFVGGFRHPPNVDAVNWLVAEIVPRIRKQLPDVPVYIAGSNAPRVVQELDGRGVTVLGFVPDLVPLLDRCRVSVSPLRYGAGVKGKVNEAMAHGLPVVATRMSVEGMGVVEGEEVIVEDDPQAFADAVVRVYRDEALWNRLSRNGLANIRRRFSTEVAIEALRALPPLAARRAT